MARVLIVDDEEVLRLAFSRQLRRSGYEVTLATDGLVAVELLQQESYDVIVSDMNMPRLDGMGLLARAAELAPTTEFIILTGHGNMENAIEAFKTGNVFDYLLKPLDDIRELSAVVERAAERRLLRSENRRLTAELELQRENQRLVAELEARVQEIDEQRRKLQFMAEHDGLTGLYNHRSIHSRLENLLREHPDTVITVVMIDLDGFKRLNDAYGHAVGDQALRHLAEALRGSCGANALIGRCGGAEFMVALPCVSMESAAFMSENIRCYMEARPFVTPDGTEIPLRYHLGMADSTRVGGAFLPLLAAADAALYESKVRGSDALTLHLADVEQKANDAIRTVFESLEQLITAIDNKDKYTRAHSVHMTGYALLLVQELGCSSETYDIVRVAGLLHDIGKIGVPDRILKKPGKLTKEEYEIMKQHVTLSTLIIHGLPNLSQIRDAVACHHERWDGQGYPRGLRGAQIPLLGRVMAVADAFSAMTLDRPYRVGMTCEEALARIEEGAGTQFDPELARIFVAAIRNNPARVASLHRAA
jgi:diguanylate cyclase (GGDEF)-like protein/putative nucleotidyltransferase with HDIG domain